MTRFTRRQTLAAALGLAAGPTARAQGFPAKPVYIIVGYSAGGAVDGIARTLGEHARASRLGRQ